MNYFSQEELECHCGCKSYNLAPGFLDALNDQRESCGHAMKINSGCRCEKHNSQEGGRDGSYHLVTHPWGCCAADVSTVGWDGSKRREFVHVAMERGWSVGIAKTFIHIDRRHIHDKDWPKPVLFTY